MDRATPFERSEPVPGAVLVTEPMPHVRSVSVGFWVDLGARDEAPEVAGTSHLLEHLVFKGTQTRSAQEIANVFDAVGGEINAYTAREHTCYYARVLDTDVELAVNVLCDMFHNALLEAPDLESERRVVLEEIHMSADVPEDRVHDLFGYTAWGNDGLGRPVVGTAETVGSISRDDVVSFYRDGYTADRLVVAAAGSVDHAQLADLITAGLQPGSQAQRRGPGGGSSFAGPHAAYEVRDSEQVHLVWGLESLARDDPDRYALAVLNALYGGGMSSRLFQEIREKLGLAYSVYSGYHSYIDTGLFAVYAGTQADSAATVLEIARRHASEIALGNLSDDEVDRAKGHVRGGLVLSMDDPGGRMTRLGRSELMQGEIPTVDELIARVDAVGAEDCARVAKRVFAGNGAALACVGAVPEGSLDAYVEPLSP